MVRRTNLNNSEFRRLRKHFEDELMRRGNRVAEAAEAAADTDAEGAKYTAQASPGKNRARVTVFPDNGKAFHEEQQHHYLLKFLNLAR